MTIATNGVVFSGGGTFQMVGAYTNSMVTGASGATITNLDHTIAGVGFISGSNLAIVNSGVISARPDAYNGAGVDTLRLEQISSITNGSGGVLEASGASTKLDLANTQVNNDGGTIRAVGNGAAVSLSNVVISGGTLTTASGGVIRADGSNVRLNGIQTTAGTMLNTNGSVTLEGGILNRGTIVENAGAGSRSMRTTSS